MSFTRSASDNVSEYSRLNPPFNNVNVRPMKNMMQKSIISFLLKYNFFICSTLISKQLELPLSPLIFRQFKPYTYRISNLYWLIRSNSWHSKMN